VLLPEGRMTLLGWLACLLLRLEHINKATPARLMDRIAPYYIQLSQGFFLDQIGHRNSLGKEARGQYS